ncbi:MAG: serine/threonine transporter SstT [Clostridia bacterium]|nr:serine/threonine transporter SstT [Clostridia bacterium]
MFILKAIAKAYNGVSLILRIVIGLAIGVALALLIPDAKNNAEWIGIFGDLFVGALKAIAPVLVFVLVVSALAQSNEKLGKQFRSVVILYLISTFMAAVIAVTASYIFPIGLTLTDAADSAAPDSIGSIFRGLLTNVVLNPVQSVASGNYLGILFWAIILGVALKKASAGTKQFLSDCSEAVTKAVRWVINFAPFGIMGLVFTAVSTSGLDIFTEYGKLLLILVGCMLVSALVVNPLMAFIVMHKNPYPLVFKCLKESGVTAFFTRSSAANIPVNMSLCEKLGLNKELYSVSIPLGATVNMAGAAVTITVMTMAAVHTMGIPVDFPVAVLLSVMAALGACGASGVAGGSLLLIPMACALFGISDSVAMQVVGVGFIIGVIQDSVETAVNSSSDALFTAVAEFGQWRKEGKEIKF